MHKGLPDKETVVSCMLGKHSDRYLVICYYIAVSQSHMKTINEGT